MCSRFSGLLSVVLLVGILLSASCTTAPSSPATSATAPAKPTAVPTATKPFGSLIVATRFGTGVIDPRAESGVTWTALTAAFLESLFDLDSKGQLVPRLAERWEISKDGLTHTYYIRKGVKFHDGSDLTGADVKFSIEWMIEPGKGINTSAVVWGKAVAGVDLIDAYTVAIRMKTPQFEFMQSPERSITAVLPKKYVEEKGIEYWNKNPIGSGPWKVVKYELGVRLELEANENYWRELPKFKNVTLLDVPEESTRIAMLKTGEADLILVSPDSVAALKSAGFRMVNSPGAIQYTGYIFYDITRPQDYAIGDARVRKALALALNRKEIIDNIYKGYAAPIIVYGANPGAYFFDANLMKVDPYDPEQAKKLMAEAGYPNGFTIKIWDILGQGAVLSMLDNAIGGYWRKVGVNAEVVPIDYGTVSTMKSPTQKPEIWPSIYIFPATGGSLEFSRMVLTYHSKLGSPRNTTDPKLDGLLEKVPTVADPAERKRLAIEAVLLAKNGYSSLPLLEVDLLEGISSKIGEVTNYYMSNSFDVRTLETITHGK
ncbi:MAG: ABC transporter substrate-binding protein [Chloroflexi bacterium]|nr:ABC transporter substrate-binding protein [Chloroflexota bacterium]